MSLLRRRMMMSSNNEASDVVEELDYLTIIPLHEEEETYPIRPCFGKVEMFGGVYTQLAPLYYRINNGEWIEVMLPDDEYDILFYINLKKGDELQLKCTTYDLNPNDYYEFYYVALHTRARFNVRGTPMSLVYGDDFKENNVAVEDSLYELFYGSKGLTEILNPKTFLPCTVLEPSCYSYMFYDCTNLVNAPELPATILADGCYLNMFKDCTKLNYIKMLATDISAEECLGNWVNGVSSTGTFVKHPDMTSLPTGIDGIPEGWVVLNDGEEEGGKIINTGRIKPAELQTAYINWDFPVASNVSVIAHTETSTYKIPTNTGMNKSRGLTLGPGESEFIVDYIEPIEDDTYIYEVIVEE